MKTIPFNIGRASSRSLTAAFLVRQFAYDSALKSIILGANKNEDVGLGAKNLLV